MFAFSICEGLAVYYWAFGRFYIVLLDIVRLANSEESVNLIQFKHVQK